MMGNLVLMGALLGAAGPAPAASRQDTEGFLRTADIVNVKEVGEGVTRPKRVTLRKDGREMKAIYKSVDTWMEMEARYGNESSRFYVDSYKAEIAAYELDKVLGLDLLPVIVERTVEGKKGSLREWVEDVMPRYMGGRKPPPADRVEDWTHTVWAFDYLIYNIDRGDTNIMVGGDWSPVVIDNSMCFNTYLKPIRPLYRFPREVVDRLRTLDRKAVARVMKPYLRGPQLDALMARIQNLLDTADRRIERDGESALFSFRAEEGR